MIEPILTANPGGSVALVNLQKFVADISNNKNVKTFVSEFNGLGQDLRRMGQELNKRLSSEKERTLHEAHARYQAMLKTITQAQRQLNSEVDKAVRSIRGSAKNVEKSLEKTRKQALARKKKIETLIKRQGAVAGKKVTTTKKKATKKVSKKVSRR